MAFDFEHNINVSTAPLFDAMHFINPVLTKLQDKINTYVYRNNFHAGDNIPYIQLKRDRHKNLYVDCYKSTWNRYRYYTQIYKEFWDNIMPILTYAKAIRWKLNPYLMYCIIDFKNNNVIKETNVTELGVLAYKLNISYIKNMLDFMYNRNNTILHKSKHNHTITLMNMVVRTNYHTKSVDKPFFVNSKEEIQEFLNWLDTKLKSKEWVINQKNWDYSSNFFDMLNFTLSL